MIEPKTTSNIEESDPDAFSTVSIGAVGVILLVVIIVAVEALFAQVSRTEFERKVVQEAPQELRSLRAAQLEQLGGYRSVDPKGGAVTIPVERAMQLLIEEGKGAPAPGPTASPVPRVATASAYQGAKAK